MGARDFVSTGKRVLQREAADLLGINPDTYRNYERGQRRGTGPDAGKEVDDPALHRPRLRGNRARHQGVSAARVTPGQFFSVDCTAPATTILPRSSAAIMATRFVASPNHQRKNLSSLAGSTPVWPHGGDAGDRALQLLESLVGQRDHVR